jgi:hypothetical protein
MEKGIEVVLTPFDETLINKDVNDENDPLDSHLTKHKHCGGFFHKYHTAPAYNRYVCSKCGLYFTVPILVNTFAKLRGHIEECGPFNR